jgi:hypothetical protein
MAVTKKNSSGLPIFVRLIPGFALARPVRRRRAQHARAKSEATLAGEHGGVRVLSERADGILRLIPGELERNSSEIRKMRRTS